MMSRLPKKDFYFGSHPVAAPQKAQLTSAFFIFGLFRQKRLLPALVGSGKLFGRAGFGGLPSSISAVGWNVVAVVSEEG
jgi:hypothetical protein